ncbi:MAG: metal-dependent transcriptional regulator [Candidatus Omnitrophota bacterium]
MTISDGAEEILEKLWETIVEDGDGYCAVEMLKDADALAELAELGYIDITDKRVTLTPEGKLESANCVRRHRLAERLFTDVLDLKGRAMDETSCRFEHLLHKGLDENICTILGHPRRCPHGKAIPEGRCCKGTKKLPGMLIRSLTELEVNQKAKISYLQTQNHELIKKIIAIGALPNTDITLVQKFPSYVFNIGKSQFAVDKELASCIYVRTV